MGPWVVGRVVAVVALFIVAVLTALLSEPGFVREALWSFHHVHSLNPMIVGFACAGLCAVCIPGVNRPVVRLLRLLIVGIARYVRRDRRRAWIVRAALFSALGLMLWAWRSHNYQLGDAGNILHWDGAFTHLRGPYAISEKPLASFVRTFAYSTLFNGFQANVMTAYGVVSCLAGLVFCGVAMQFSVAVAKHELDRFLVVALLFSVGAVQLFFGYVEYYSCVTAMILVYAWLSWRCLSGYTRLRWPAAALGLAVAFHQLALFLTPSLVVLTGIVAWRRRQRATALALETLISGFAPIGAVLLLAYGLDHPVHFARTSGGSLVFQQLSGTAECHYSFLSFAHIVAVANALCLAALSPLIGYLCMRPTRRPSHVEREYLLFLGALIGCSLLLVTVWNPDLGPQTDWDLFSIPAVPLAVGLAFCLMRLHSQRLRRYLAVICVCAGFAHAGSWVYVNANVDQQPAYAKVYARYTRYCVRAGLDKEAVLCWLAALEYDPELKSSENGLSVVPVEPMK